MNLKAIFDSNINAEDIKYHGKLGYRHLRIIAWLLFGLSLLTMCFALGITLRQFAQPPIHSPAMEGAKSFFSFLSGIPLPLFLIANFSFIFRHKNKMNKLFKRYFLLGGLIILLFIFVCTFYLMRSEILILHKDTKSAYLAVNRLLDNNSTYSISFNVFVDLILCTSSYYFLTYTPKHKFKGKKIIWFRLLIIIPILYEIASAALKMYTNDIFREQMISIPFFVYPFLTSKPLLTYFAFLIIVIVIIVRKKILLKKGFTEEEYDKFLQTNRNSTQFAIIASTAFLIVGIIDIIFYYGLAPQIRDSSGFANLEEAKEYLRSFGFSKTYPSMFCIPIFLFFDYRKTYKNTKVDILVTIFGVCFCVFTFLEGMFEVITHSPLF